MTGEREKNEIIRISAADLLREVELANQGEIFFQEVFLLQVEGRLIEDVDDLYDALDKHRLIEKTEMTVSDIVIPAWQAMSDAIVEFWQGRMSIGHFFNMERAYSLMVEAVTESERYWSEPGHTLDIEEEKDWIEIVRYADEMVFRPIFEGFLGAEAYQLYREEVNVA